MQEQTSKVLAELACLHLFLFMVWEHCCTYTWDGLHRDQVS